MVSGLLVFVIVTFSLLVFQCWDEELEVKPTVRARVVLALICILGGAFLCERQQGDESRYIRGVIMLVYLVLCSVTDYYTKQVYDLVQLGACMAVAVGILPEQAAPVQGAELIIYALLQGLIFRKMYGEADVMGFLICALSLVEGGILVWTCHMGIAFLLLGVLQGIKGNIGAGGNLKHPVAFFPYMAVAYAIVF